MFGNFGGWEGRRGYHGTSVGHPEPAAPTSAPSRMDDM